MGNDTRRFVLAIALSLGFVFLWTYVTGRKGPSTRPPAPAAGRQATAPTAPTPEVGPEGGTPAAPAPPSNAPEETVALDGEGFRATLTTYGGALRHLTLGGEKFRRKENGKEVAIDLVRTGEGQPFPLSLVPSPELGGSQDVVADRSARAPMQIVSRDARSVVFEGRVGTLAVRKTYRVTGKPYELSLEVEVQGGGAGTVNLLFPAYVPPEAEKGGFFSGPALEYVRPICRAGTGTERLDLSKDGRTAPAGEAAWVGTDQHYFVAAVLPGQPVGSCVLASGPVKGSGVAVLAVPLERARKLALAIYAGPKDLDHLRGYGQAFDTAIDYGAAAKFFAFFARGLLYVMRWLERLVQNWGVAIILLTVLVRVVLFPLTYKSMQSMNEMRKLQPEMEKLKVKYGEDKEKLNKAVMQMYQQHKVNPLGGCLPMLLQMPIWFSLYAALQTSVELYREPFLWIQDLTVKDPIYVLPLLMGASSFITQRLSPQPADSTQAKMMLYFFPIFFTFIMLNVPAGLTLYIFVNNLLSIVQQQAMMKHQPAMAPAK